MWQIKSEVNYLTDNELGIENLSGLCITLKALSAQLHTCYATVGKTKNDHVGHLLRHMAGHVEYFISKDKTLNYGTVAPKELDNMTLEQVILKLNKLTGELADYANSAAWGAVRSHLMEIRTTLCDTLSTTKFNIQARQGYDK